MTREIKFRQAIFINDHFSHFHYWGFCGKAWLPPNLDYTTPEVALENSRQFTGLYDKNSKEIYEGDIVQLTCGCGYQENLPVEWQDGRNGYFARVKYQHDWDNDQLSLAWPERYAEVIGDIYSNPEFTKEEK